MGAVQSSSVPKRKHDGGWGENSGRATRTRHSKTDDAARGCCSNCSSSPLGRVLGGLSAGDTNQAICLPDEENSAPDDARGNHGSPLRRLLNGLSADDTNQAICLPDEENSAPDTSGNHGSPLGRLLSGLSAEDANARICLSNKENSALDTRCNHGSPLGRLLSGLSADDTNKVICLSCKENSAPSSQHRSLFRLLRPDEVGQAQKLEYADRYLREHGIHPKDATASYSALQHVVSGRLETRLDTARGDIYDFSGETEQSLSHRQDQLGSSLFAQNGSMFFREVVVGRGVGADEIVRVEQVPENLPDLSSTESRARETTFDEQIERTLELFSETRARVSDDEEVDRFSPDSILPLENQMALHDRFVAKIEAREEDSIGFELPSSLKRTVEIRPNHRFSGALAVFVAVGYHNPHQGCSSHKFGSRLFADGEKIVRVYFNTEDLDQQLTPCIEQFLDDMATEKKIGRQATLTHEEFMSALVERIRKSPAFIGHVDNNPLSPMDWWVKSLSNLHSACGTTETVKKNVNLKWIPCLCSDPDCKEDVLLFHGATYGYPKLADGQAHLLSVKCAEERLNLRQTRSGHQVFDAPLFDMSGIPISNKTICPLIFKQGNRSSSSWAVMGKQLTPQARALDVLNGTGLGDSLVGSTNALRLARNEYQREHRSREGNRDRRNEQQRNRNRARAEDRRDLRQQQLAELDGDDSLSEEKKLERIELVLESSRDLYVKHGEIPHFYVSDAKYAVDARNQLKVDHRGEPTGEIHNREQERWLFRQRTSTGVDSSIILQGPSLPGHGQNFTPDLVGEWGSGKALEVDYFTIPISHHGFMSRGAETDLIRWLKRQHPGLALNQNEVGPDTSIRAIRNNCLIVACFVVTDDPVYEATMLLPDGGGAGRREGEVDGGRRPRWVRRSMLIFLGLGAGLTAVNLAISLGTRGGTSGEPAPDDGEADDQSGTSPPLDPGTSPSSFPPWATALVAALGAVVLLGVPLAYFAYRRGAASDRSSQGQIGSGSEAGGRNDFGDQATSGGYHSRPERVVATIPRPSGETPAGIHLALRGGRLLVRSVDPAGQAGRQGLRAGMAVTRICG
ncbi:hypothetical protein THAOC_01195, partial [Thalassiosira oceanica]